VDALRARAFTLAQRGALADSFDLGSLIDEFRDEARDQVDALDRALLRIERGPDLGAADRNAVLRNLHTLKGNAGMLGFSAIRDFVHVVEAVVKEERPTWPDVLVERLFEGATALRRAVESAGRTDQDAAFNGLNVSRRRLEEGDPDLPGDAGPAVAAADADAAPEGDDRLRVPFGQLDSLLSEVGELLGEAESLVGLVATAPRAEAIEMADALRRRSDRLRSAVMSLRLVPLGRTVGRFHGLVRRLARDQAKEARLVVEGESTELDKSTADALAEPLLHLVRNAIDHGIESPAEREAAGKPRYGTLRIVAEREGDRIRIQLEDDGSGLDLEAVRRRARGAGLAPAGADLSEADLTELIFAPGLTTREDASTVSGRGLGLDVVRRSVQKLRGELRVERLEGSGTRFTIRLPVAVALVPSLVFEAAGETLAVPATAVVRTVALGPVARVGPTEVLPDGEELVPLVDLDRLFRWAPAPRGRFGVHLRWGRGGAAITAARLLHQRDLVVKAMPGFGARPAVVTGASVLPGGKVILVLDPAELVRMAGSTAREAGV
jgi:two-component system, chemotaxis family, sensor kinase CheA